MCNASEKNKSEHINRTQNTSLRLQKNHVTSKSNNTKLTSGGGKKEYDNHNNNHTVCVFGCVFCSVPLLFVYLRMRISENASSIAGVLFDSVGSLRATLLLHTTCMRS